MDYPLIMNVFMREYPPPACLAEVLNVGRRTGGLAQNGTLLYFDLYFVFDSFVARPRPAAKAPRPPRHSSPRPPPAAAACLNPPPPAR